MGRKVKREILGIALGVKPPLCMQETLQTQGYGQEEKSGVIPGSVLGVPQPNRQRDPLARQDNLRAVGEAPPFRPRAMGQHGEDGALGMPQPHSQRETPLQGRPTSGL